MMNWFDFYSPEEREKLNSLWIEKAKVLLINNRLIGLELADAIKAVEALGFAPYVIEMSRTKYGIVGAVYISREIKLYHWENETVVVHASHGAVQCQCKNCVPEPVQVSSPAPKP